MRARAIGSIVAITVGCLSVSASAQDVFGEVGGAFARSATTPQEQRTSSLFTSSSRAVSRSFGARSGAGAILYF